ncbi:MAG: hypothetical protein AB7S61_04975 [Methanoregulaceae archaeon]
MPSCGDCVNYTATGKETGECRLIGPVPEDRDAERCPARLFIPRET